MVIVCDEFEVVGCQDLLALNYDSDATDQGNCEYLGCMDSLYFEYNPNATESNGSCYTEVISGCMIHRPIIITQSKYYDGSSCSINNIKPYLCSNPIDGLICLRI